MIFYLAHPVAPTPEELSAWMTEHPGYSETTARARMVGDNVERALAWFRWIVDNAPGWTICMPWLAYVDVYGDDGGPMREVGLRAMERAAARHDGVITCGGRVSDGMRRERDAALRAGRVCLSLIDLGPRPPTSGDQIAHLPGGTGGATDLLHWRLRVALGG